MNTAPRVHPKTFKPPRPYDGPPVVVLGDALIDRVYKIGEMPAPGGDAALLADDERPGGAGLNVSVALAGAGIRCCLVTTTGGDRRGRLVRDYLARAGVDTSFLQRTGRTGLVLSFADASGERTMFSYRGASAAPVDMTPALAAALGRAPLLFMSGYGLLNVGQVQSYLAAARYAREAGSAVAFDPGPEAARLGGGLDSVRDALAMADVLLVNEAELYALFGRSGGLREVAASVLRHVSYLGLKLGRRGCLVGLRRATGAAAASDRSEAILLECPVREVVTDCDTTGAGDAFDAGFLAAMLYEMPPPAWGSRGNDLAYEILAGRAWGVSRRGT